MVLVFVAGFREELHSTLLFEDSVAAVSQQTVAVVFEQAVAVAAVSQQTAVVVFEQAVAVAASEQNFSAFAVSEQVAAVLVSEQVAAEQSLVVFGFVGLGNLLSGFAVGFVFLGFG